MRIGIICEGQTERAFMPHVREFLAPRLSGRMPKLDLVPMNGRIPKGDKLKKLVLLLLNGATSSAGAVIALTDVYTGTNGFTDAADAKQKMRAWVGADNRFFPHAAQHDFEAWLLPYWSEIQRLAGHNRAVPGERPETINHGNPPSMRNREIFRQGSRGADYVKSRDIARILRGKDLLISAAVCPELKAFLNTILTLGGGAPIP